MTSSVQESKPSAEASAKMRRTEACVSVEAVWTCSFVTVTMLAENEAFLVLCFAGGAVLQGENEFGKTDVLAVIVGEKDQLESSAADEVNDLVAFGAIMASHFKRRSEGLKTSIQ